MLSFPYYLGLRLNRLRFSVDDNAEDCHHICKEGVGKDVRVLGRQDVKKSQLRKAGSKENQTKRHDTLVFG
jgi:hypothetical protein